MKSVFQSYLIDQLTQLKVKYSCLMGDQKKEYEAEKDSLYSIVEIYEASHAPLSHTPVELLSSVSEKPEVRNIIADFETIFRNIEKFESNLKVTIDTTQKKYEMQVQKYCKLKEVKDSNDIEKVQLEDQVIDLK